LIQECIDLRISDTVMTSQDRNKFRARRSKHTQSLKHSFKKVSVSHAQLAHFSTLAKEKHMLLILNFSTLTFITNARTTMPFARLHSQMVCTQSEPALEDVKLFHKDIYALIVDLTSAFNTTDHDRMLWIMYDLGFPNDAIDAVKNLYEDATIQVKLPSGVCTGQIPVERGTIQGDRKEELCRQ